MGLTISPSISDENKCRRMMRMMQMNVVLPIEKIADFLL
jgi:hypothetical protein